MGRGAPGAAGTRARASRKLQRLARTRKRASSPESLRLDPKTLCRLETYSSPGAPASCGEKGLGEPWGLRGP